MQDDASYDKWAEREREEELKMPYEERWKMEDERERKWREEEKAKKLAYKNKQKSLIELLDMADDLCRNVEVTKTGVYMEILPNEVKIAQKLEKEGKLILHKQSDNKYQVVLPYWSKK